MPVRPYIVDISKPPIVPPGREMHDTFWRGLVETKASKARTQAWLDYMKRYEKEIAEKKRALYHPER